MKMATVMCIKANLLIMCLLKNLTMWEDALLKLKKEVNVKETLQMEKGIAGNINKIID